MQQVFRQSRSLAARRLSTLKTSHLGICKLGCSQTRSFSGDQYFKYEIKSDPYFNSSLPKLSDTGKQMMIKWDLDSDTNTFQSIWLRHQCHCPNCMQQTSGHTFLHPTKLTPPISVNHAQLNEDQIDLEWKDSNQEVHSGFIPLKWLYMNRSTFQYSEPATVEAKTMHQLNFEDIMVSRSSFYKYLYYLNYIGIVNVRGCPEDGYIKLAEKISQNKFSGNYGTLFEIKAEDVPGHSLADTDGQIIYHQDLPYFQTQPGIQHLQCINNDKSVVGGDLYVIDLINAGEKFRKLYPGDFDVLSKVSVNFQYINFNLAEPLYLKLEKKHFKLNENGDLILVSWNPALNNPLTNPSDPLAEKYYEAYAKFQSYLDCYDDKFEYIYEPGCTVSFHNVRMSHSRNKFKLNGGKRILRGCYSPIDYYHSCLRYLSLITGHAIPRKLW